MKKYLVTILLIKGVLLEADFIIWGNYQNNESTLELSPKYTGQVHYRISPINAVGNMCTEIEGDLPLKKLNKYETMAVFIPSKKIGTAIDAIDGTPITHKQCKLLGFSILDGKVDVTTDGCNELLCGMGVSYDGIYEKVKN